MQESIPVRPVRPPTPYIGGKRNLAAKIIERIEATPHSLYAEVFMGAGGVFLRRRYAARTEIINDRSRDVATFFRVLQRHYVAFMELLKFQLTSRAEFQRLVATDPDTLTDLDRSARFLYLQRTAFGGKVAGRNFGVIKDGPARFDITRLGPILDEVHSRLSAVVIECMPWADFIRRYDKTGALFYLDPPYFGSESDYGKDLFERSEFEVMADLLSTLKGRFILSLNDVPRVRHIFRDFNLAEVETTYTVAGSDNAKKAAELIITGGGSNG